MVGLGLSVEVDELARGVDVEVEAEGTTIGGTPTCPSPSFLVLGRLSSTLVPINLPLPSATFPALLVSIFSFPTGLGTMLNSALFALTARSNRSPSSSAFMASLTSLTGSSAPDRLGNGRARVPCLDKLV